MVGREGSGQACIWKDLLADLGGTLGGEERQSESASPTWKRGKGCGRRMKGVDSFRWEAPWVWVSTEPAVGEEGSRMNLGSGQGPGAWLEVMVRS